MSYVCRVVTPEGDLSYQASFSTEEEARKALEEYARLSVLRALHSYCDVVDLETAVVVT